MGGRKNQNNPNQDEDPLLYLKNCSKSFVVLLPEIVPFSGFCCKHLNTHRQTFVSAHAHTHTPHLAAVFVVFYYSGGLLSDPTNRNTWCV